MARDRRRLSACSLGLLFAAWRELADRSVRTPTELEELAGAPVLGAMAYDRAAASTPLITSLGTHHPRFEAVRILRTNLQFLDVDRDHKVITITSSLAGEGKSTTACNLAIALAQTGTRVVLVEGDLRRPRVSEYLGIEKSVGLTTVLVGRVALDAALQQAGTPGLDVLTSGALPPNPSEILQTKAMTALIAELRHRYEVVLIDAPPLLPVTDASLLASISDGAILVVTPRIDRSRAGSYGHRSPAGRRRPAARHRAQHEPGARAEPLRLRLWLWLRPGVLRQDRHRRQAPRRSPQLTAAQRRGRAR